VDYLIGLRVVLVAGRLRGHGTTVPVSAIARTVTTLVP
jgi:hypothetical protein